MSPIILSFLALEVVIVLVGTLLGLKRGLGKTVVRTVYLLVIGLVSFLIARLLTPKFLAVAVNALQAIYPEDLKSMFAASPEMEGMLASFLAAFAVPVCFAVLFGLLQLLTLIGFRPLSEKILAGIVKTENVSSGSRAAGAAVGLLVAVFVASFLLSPLFMASSVVMSVPEKHLESLGIAEVVESGQPSAKNLLSAQTAVHLLSTDEPMPGIFVINKVVANSLTSFKTPAGAQTTVYQEIPIVTHLAFSMMDAHSKTLELGGDDIDALTNAGAILELYVDDSEFIRELASGAISAVGAVLSENHTIFGVELASPDDHGISAIMDSFIETISHTTSENLKANLVTLFGKPSHDLLPQDKLDTKEDLDFTHITKGYHNAGIISAFTHLNALHTGDNIDPEAAKKGELAIASAFATMADNDAMDAVFKDVSAFASDLISQNASGLLDESSKETYKEVAENVQNTIAAVQESTTEEKVEAVKEVVNDSLSEFDMEIEDWQSSIIASCAVKEFCGDDYLDENGNPTVSIEDIMIFFGVSDEEIPDWAK